MKETDVPYRELLVRAADQLAKIPTNTDRLMLTKWRSLSFCQYLLGTPERELEDACKTALEVFVTQGVGPACDRAFEAAGAVIRRVEGVAKSVLPSMSKEKRAAVSEHLNALAAADPTVIERALHVLPTIRERVRTTAQTTALPGIRYRFDLVASVLEDSRRPDRERIRAAASVLYVEEIQDAIPDTWGVIGMLDDDYALRVVLEELGEEQVGSCLHWSEKISSLWDDLPFLQGVNLQRQENAIPVSWLDRVNSYLSYCHVFRLEGTPLLLLQPSVACLPLHSIVSLLGLLLLDTVTSAENKTQTLRIGCTYEIDGLFVRYEGAAGPPTPGWLRLRVRDGVVCRPPGLADRMIPINHHRLSSGGELSARSRMPSADPIQRFFNWESAIGPASIPSRLVLVASRKRALYLLEGIQSNGVRLLDHGLVRFIAAVPDQVETHSTLILVVPSLKTTRLILDQGVRLQAVFVDGYEQLRRGRHELPFLMNRQSAPPIISWSATGYYPVASPAWLPPNKRLEVCSDDLANILDLDGQGTEISDLSLWEAATGTAFQEHSTPTPESERVIVETIDAFVHNVRSSHLLPDYWQYQLTRFARTLQTLVSSTPAEWAEIKRVSSLWSATVNERWSTFRPSAAARLLVLREAEARILQLLETAPDGVNSRAAALCSVLSAATSEQDRWHFACHEPAQKRAVESLIRALGLQHVEAVLLPDLAVCSNCVVAGWVSSSFARRLWAHTPRSLLALVNERDRRRWERAVETQRYPIGQSALEAVGGLSPPPELATIAGPADDAEDWVVDDAYSEWTGDDRVSCVFLWPTGESDAKVLARGSRVFVEEGDMVKERDAARLLPDDRVILGYGTNRWSPAEEFTEAVVEAVKASHPELARTAKEWRRALVQMRDEQHLSTAHLQARLCSVGVERGVQTIDGWVGLEKASPIAPRTLRPELSALWALIAQYAEYSFEEIVAACAQLRLLRASSGRALLQLWKGRTVKLEIDEEWLSELVDRLRQKVQVYEIEAVTLGEVPTTMLGWWIPPELAGRFESGPNQTLPPGEDDEGES